MSSNRVLLIEDNEQNMELVSYLLEENGMDVRIARDVDEFQVVIREPPPDLILLDMHLPGKDGLTLLKELRAEPGFTSIPVVALTAHAMRGDKERFLEAGCNGYISKPINVKTFIDEIRVFLTEEKS